MQKKSIMVQLSLADQMLLSRLTKLNGDSSRQAVIRAALRSYAEQNGLPVFDDEVKTEMKGQSAVYLGQPLNA